jgi:hypothetical protein
MRSLIKFKPLFVAIAFFAFCIYAFYAVDNRDSLKYKEESKKAKLELGNQKVNHRTQLIILKNELIKASPITGEREIDIVFTQVLQKKQEGSDDKQGKGQPGKKPNSEG